MALPKQLKVVRKNWFSDSNIESVVIPSAVELLGEIAFGNCPSLK